MNSDNKVELYVCPWKRNWYEDSQGILYRNWIRALAFIVNPRGVLVHRLKWARTTIERDGQSNHKTYGYWCGNVGNPLCELVGVPPEGMLVCARCEALAVAGKAPTSSEIVGRHVCLGGLRAKRLCCVNESN